MQIDIQKVGAKILLTLHSLSSVLKLYETNNTAVTRQTDSMFKELEAFFAKGGEEFRLTLREDEFFVCDRLLKVDLQLYLRAKELALTLKVCKYGDIRFSNKTTKKDLEVFVTDFSASLRESAPKLKPSYGGISGKEALGSSAAAFRFEPNKLAIWLYAGLLDVVQNLYLSVGKGEYPSLLPVRRSLQLIIDNMREHNGIYQILSAIRDPSAKRNRTNMYVAAAVDAVGFGLFTGLSNVVLMDLALTAVLGGISTSKDPITSVTPLFQFKGLGDAALGLILTLHDARASRQGKSSSNMGKILMIVEAYQQILEEDLRLPLPHAIRKMSTGELQGVDQDVAKLFARYKGLFPIGSVVEVGSSKAIVIGHSDNDVGKKRPIVKLITVRGRLGEQIDLSKRKDLSITKSLSLYSEKIRLEAL